MSVHTLFGTKLINVTFIKEIQKFAWYVVVLTKGLELRTNAYKLKHLCGSPCGLITRIATQKARRGYCCCLTTHSDGLPNRRRGIHIVIFY